jgi:hypothetical protein
MLIFAGDRDDSGVGGRRPQLLCASDDCAHHEVTQESESQLIDSRGCLRIPPFKNVHFCSLLVIDPKGDRPVKGSLQSHHQFDQEVHRGAHRQTVHRTNQDQGRIQLHSVECTRYLTR